MYELYSLIKSLTQNDSLNNILSVNEGKLNNTIGNLDDMSNNLNKVSGSLAKIDVNQLKNSLETVLANFDKLSKDLNSGKGTAGKLLNDDKLYDNLESTSKQLELLLQDLRLNPKRYVHISVFGKKNTPYEKPADSIK